ncbi:unnamed protein product [marine sediment metagenome]|uniref:Uncharacterized protein n=1 Tax=marine sediment metagenome TaxID=412755 RepID=X0VU62_9ZZZZ
MLPPAIRNADVLVRDRSSGKVLAGLFTVGKTWGWIVKDTTGKQMHDFFFNTMDQASDFARAELEGA